MSKRSASSEGTILIKRNRRIRECQSLEIHSYWIWWITPPESIQIFQIRYHKYYSLVVCDDSYFISCQFKSSHWDLARTNTTVNRAKFYHSSNIEMWSTSFVKLTFSFVFNHIKSGWNWSPSDYYWERGNQCKLNVRRRMRLWDYLKRKTLCFYSRKDVVVRCIEKHRGPSFTFFSWWIFFLYSSSILKAKIHRFGRRIGHITGVQYQHLRTAEKKII